LQESLGKAYVARAHWMSENWRCLCPHMSVYLKVTSAEENFSNQVDKMIFSLDNSQPLSLANLVIIYWLHKHRCQGGMDGGYTWTQQHGLHLPRLTCYSYCKRLNLPAAENSTESPV
jgi:hypothetical protein